MMLRSAFVFSLFLFLNAAFAGHLPGGTITYTCLGENYFEVKLSLLWECSGFEMLEQDLHFTNSCGVVFAVSDIQPVLVDNALQLCEADSSSSTCDGGTLPGFRLYEFTTQLILSPCSYWTIYWSCTGCRQGSVNVQSFPGLYIETRIDNIAEACNNAPLFDHMGVPRVCIGQPVNYDAGVIDNDANRLEYSLIDARQVTNTSPLTVNSVNYVFPNYGGEPIAGMAIDQYGQITFTPAVQGYIIVVVQVDEYDENEQWIGSVMRDFTFIASPCSNITPNADSGNLTAVTGNASMLGERALQLCDGNEACATIEFTDPDEGQSLSIWTSVDQVLPGAIVETSGTDPLEVNICWSAITVGTGSYSFVITVMDDACPVRGARSFVYTVEVIEAPYAGMDGTALACARALPFTLADSLQGDPPPGGTWTDPQGEWHDGFFNGSLDQPGTYIYSVTEGVCTGTAALEIEFIPEDDPLCVFIGIEEIDEHEITVYPNPSTGRVTFYGGEWSAAPIGIHDVQGRLIRSEVITVSGDEAVLEFPQELLNGIYFLRGSDRNGSPFVIRTVLER